MINRSKHSTTNVFVSRDMINIPDVCTTTKTSGGQVRQIRVMCPVMSKRTVLKPTYSILLRSSLLQRPEEALNSHQTNTNQSIQIAPSAVVEVSEKMLSIVTTWNSSSTLSQRAPNKRLLKVRSTQRLHPHRIFMRFATRQRTHRLSTLSVTRQSSTVANHLLLRTEKEKSGTALMTSPRIMKEGEQLCYPALNSKNSSKQNRRLPRSSSRE